MFENSEDRQTIMMVIKKLDELEKNKKEKENSDDLIKNDDVISIVIDKKSNKEIENNSDLMVKRKDITDVVDKNYNGDLTNDEPKNEKLDKKMI